MEIDVQDAIPVRWRQWRQAALSFLALSAAVSVQLLEERSDNGLHRYTRGRHKYYGIGSLVIFFAVFSGYGMGHMLATMSTFSTWSASIAGVIWAVFQWSLERQILLSIRSDASIWKKVFGFSWRALLALLSASTLVYPFFVESNRAEIDVKVGEMARVRSVDNLQSAQLAVGLPGLNNDFSALELSIKTVGLALISDPPDLAVFRQKAKLCWNHFYDEELSINRKIKQIRVENVGLPPDAVNVAKIDVLAQKISTSRAVCQAAEAQVLNKIIAWKEQKNTEKKILANQRDQVKVLIDQAKLRESELIHQQETKITRAAQSGFAADFVAVADLVRNDSNRRFQLIWWLTWFLAIELVVILVKFTSVTDIDFRLNSDETLANEQIKNSLSIALDQLATQRLRATMKTKGEQAGLQEVGGRYAQELIEHEMVLQHTMLQQIKMFDVEMRSVIEHVKIALVQLVELEKMTQPLKQSKNGHYFSEAIERAASQIFERLTEALAVKIRN